MITKTDVMDVLKTIKDPETELDIVELLLVNDVTVRADGKQVIVDMGFQRKTPGCKACVTLAWYIQSKIIRKIEDQVSALPGVESVEVLSN
jgi:metal-sulfur cluster biosynthetic enzyme